MHDRVDAITNGDESRRFASRKELCSESGEVEKTQDGIFQQAMSRNPAERAMPRPLTRG